MVPNCKDVGRKMGGARRHLELLTAVTHSLLKCSYFPPTFLFFFSLQSFRTAGMSSPQLNKLVLRLLVSSVSSSFIPLLFLCHFVFLTLVTFAHAEQSVLLLVNVSAIMEQIIGDREESNVLDFLLEGHEASQKWSRLTFT